MKIHIVYKLRDTGTPHDSVLDVDNSSTLTDVHGLFIESIRQNFDNDVVGDLYNSHFFFNSSRYALPANIVVSDLLLPYRAMTIADASHVNPNIQCDIHLRLSPFPPLLPRPKAKRNHSMSFATISYRERYNLGLLFMYKWSRPKTMIIQDDVLYLYRDMSTFSADGDPIFYLPLCGCRPYAVEQAHEGKWLLVLQQGDINVNTEASAKASISAKLDSFVTSIGKDKKANANAVVRLTKDDVHFQQRETRGELLFQPYATTFTINDMLHPADGIYVFAFEQQQQRDAYYHHCLLTHRRHVLDVCVQCVLQLSLRRAYNTEGLFRISGSKTSMDVLFRDLYSGAYIDFSSASIPDEHVLTGLLKHIIRNMVEPPMSFQGYEYWAQVYTRAEEAVDKGGVCERVFVTARNQGDASDRDAARTNTASATTGDKASSATAEEEEKAADLSLDVDAPTTVVFDPEEDDEDRMMKTLPLFVRQGLAQLHPQNCALLYLVCGYLQQLLAHKDATRMDSKNYGIVFCFNLIRSHPSVASLNATAARLSSTPQSPVPAPVVPRHQIGGGAGMFMGAPPTTVTPAVVTPAPAPTITSADPSTPQVVDISSADVDLDPSMQAPGTSRLRRCSTGVGHGVTAFFSRDSVLGGGGMTGMMGVGPTKKKGLDDLVMFLIENADELFKDFVVTE